MRILRDISKMNYEKRKGALANTPFFCAKNVNGVVQTRGLNACLLGHKVGDPSRGKTDGIFAEWEWDGQKLIVNNDRYGFYPLYYYYRDNEIIISPSIRKLIDEGASNELDYPALSVFLRIGHYVGEDTPFKYILTLPPNVTFSWEQGRLMVSGQFARREIIDISEDDAIDRYIHLFRESVKKRLPDNVDFIVPLSSGRDSRHILLELSHLGYKPKECVTLRPYSTLYFEDMTPAEVLAEALNVKHVIGDEGSFNFINELRNIESTNYCADEHAQLLPLADYIRNAGVAVVYDGLGGDTLSDSFRCCKDLHLLKERSFTEFSKRYFKSYDNPSEYDLRLILSDQFYDNVGLDRALMRLEAEYIKHCDHPSPTKSFFFWNRTRREIALMPYANYAGVPKVYSPYLDHDLFDFLMSLPEEFTRQKTFHPKAIERAYPDYAGIPYSTSICIKEKNDKSKISYVQGFAKHCLKNFVMTSSLIKTENFLPRMTKCLLSKRYCLNSWWMKFPKLLYLIQLEKLRNKGAQL